MAFTFPGWAETRFLSDDVFGSAYDMQRPEERAWLKTAITRIVAACGGVDGTAVRSSRSLRQGFCLHEQASPANWALVMWDGACASPTRILAALLPAMLAGVPQILTCRVAPLPDGGGDMPFSPAVLAALELAGQELVADFRPEEALRLIHDCAETDRQGRVVLLGDSEYFEGLAGAVTRCGIPARHLAHPARIGMDTASLPDDTAMPPHGILRAMHPDAAFVPITGPGEKDLCAVFCGESALGVYLPHVPLVLTPGNEVCWVWSDLGPKFFRNISLAFSGPGDCA